MLYERGGSNNYCVVNADCEKLYFRELRTGTADIVLLREPDDTTWVYALTDSSGEVIYIGQTVSRPEARVNQHRYNGHWWSDKIAGFVSVATRYSELDSTETALIHLYHPWGNKKCLACPGSAIDHRATPPVTISGSEFVAAYGNTEQARKHLAERQVSRETQDSSWW